MANKHTNNDINILTANQHHNSNHSNTKHSGLLPILTQLLIKEIGVNFRKARRVGASIYQGEG